jgi:hypothetical protein
MLKGLVLGLVLVVGCGGGINIEAESVIDPPPLNTDAPECPGALRWRDYFNNDELWRECWCKEGVWGDWIFRVDPAKVAEYRAQWLAYQARGCVP